MFTGIIEDLGQVLETKNNNGRIKFSLPKIFDDIKIGDSIAVNGICLTVTDFDKNSFWADISPETLNISTLKNLKTNDFVNLERALKVSDRFGGHVVSGHVDSIAKIYNIKKNNDFIDLEIEIKNDIQKYVIKKGSITVNGISLTIAEIRNNIISFAIIPHTFNNTNLKYLKIGDFINIETDILAKYVEKILLISHNSSRIDLNFLKENGF